MRKIVTLGIVLMVVGCSGPKGPKGEVFEVGGIALSGYDPVAYFEQNGPGPGVATITSEYDGLIYQFTSTKNKALFDEDPERYLPEYGGWCAYAIAETSSKMQPDPTMWQIQDGRLLLFYDDWMTSFSGSLKEKWNENPESYLEKADENWPETQAKK